MHLKIGLALLLLSFVASEDYSNGFRGQFKWCADVDSALREGRETGKPVVIIIHKSWCPHCAKLREEFGDNQPLLEISSQFVLVNCVDDDEPAGPSYAPDGYYVPRIIFKWGSGETIHCTNRWGLKRYKQYFPNPNHLLNCLKEIAADVQQHKNDTITT